MTSDRPLPEETGSKSKSPEVSRPAADAIEAKMLQLVDTLPAYLWIGDAKGNITWLNEFWYKNTGLTQEQSLGTGWAQVLHPDDYERCLKRWLKSLETASVYEVEVRYRMADGSYRWVLARAEPLRDSDGKITNWFGTSFDIEDKKRAEDALQAAHQNLETRVEARTAELAGALERLNESQTRFRLAVDHYPATFVIYDSDLRVQLINPDGAALSGKPEKEIIGKRDEDILPQEIYAQYLPLLDEVIKTGKSQSKEITLPLASGPTTFIYTYVPVSDRSGQVQQILGITHDVTARRQAEQQREMLEQAIETTTEAIAIIDSGGLIQYVNRGFEKLFGYDHGELIGQDVQIVNAGPAPEKTRDSIMAPVGESGFWSGEVFNRKKDGTEFYSEASVAAVRDDNGNLLYVIAAQRDITERKQAEQEQHRLLAQVVKEQQAYAELAAVLQTERDIMKTIMENTRTQLAYLDDDFNFIAVNAAYAAGSGHTVEELVGHNHFELFPNEENKAIFKRVRDTGKPVEFRKKPFIYIDQPERDITYWDWSLVPVKDQQGKPQGFVFSLLDVTDEVRADQELAAIHARAELERRRLRATLDVLPIGVIIADENGKLVDRNNAARAIWEGDPTDVDSPDKYGIYKAWWPESGERLKPEDWGMARAVQKGESSSAEEVEIETFKENRKTSLNYAVPIRDAVGNIRGGVAVNVDITERKRAQQKLRETEERYSLAQRLAHIGAWDWDIVNDNLRWSEQVAPILGLDPDLREVRLETFASTIHPEDKKQIETAIDNCLKKGVHYAEEHRIIWPDGTVRWVEEMGDVIHDERGRPVRMVGMIYDITNRKLILEAKARLAAIVESSDDAIIGKTPEGIITSWNTGAEKMYGYRSHEAVGQSILMIIPRDRADEESEILARVRQGERIEQMDTIRERRGGEQLYVSLSISPIMNEKGRVVAISTIARDITEQKRAEWALRESEERFRVALKHSQISVAHVDGNGRYTWAHNPPKGLPLGKLLGRRMEELVPCDGAREMTEAKRKVFETGVGLRGEFTLELADGTHYFDMTAEPLFDGDGKVAGVTSAALDITDRKQTEQEIKKMNEMLTIHAVELAEANKELEAFSYSVSHDLRAPLRSIDGFSLALLEDYGEALDDTAKDYLRRVRGASQNMAQLIDDLLKLSRVSRTEIRHETVDLSKIAREFAGELRNSEPEREVEFVIEDGLTAYGDHHLLKIVIENFLRNSWKFTAKHSTARIEFGRTEKSGEPLYYIRDDGAGFDMNYADKLFLVFQRLHSTSEFAGTGVGLPLIKRIIERHGGRVWGEGEVEKGATFYFTL